MDELARAADKSVKQSWAVIFYLRLIELFEGTILHMFMDVVLHIAAVRQKIVPYIEVQLACWKVDT